MKQKNKFQYFIIILVLFLNRFRVCCFHNNLFSQIPSFKRELKRVLLLHVHLPLLFFLYLLLLLLLLLLVKCNFFAVIFSNTFRSPYCHKYSHHRRRWHPFLPIQKCFICHSILSCHVKTSPITTKFNPRILLVYFLARSHMFHFPPATEYFHLHRKIPYSRDI